ncbi:MAG: glycosyltransferase [Bacteroidetes bacterium]|nr:glycosyltransferase [Bacteroidota bacterium]
MSKIIIIGPAYPLRGGIANFNEALCAAYTNRGDTCSIVSFSLQYPNFLFPGATQFAGADPAPAGLHIVTLLNSINPISWWKTARYIRAQKPDLVVIRYWLPFMAPCLGSVARLLKRGNSGITVQAICDNVVPHEQRWGDRMLTAYFVNSCDRFVVMSQSVLADLRTFTQAPATVRFHPIYNIFGDAVPTADARRLLGLEANANYLLFFGFIRKYKGLDLLLEALADPQLANSNVQLIIAGEFYDDPQPYLQLIQKLQLTHRVHLHTHYIPKEQVKNYFCAANLVVQPYRNATQSGVTQIAYHFNKPMLVTNVGGLPEMVPNGVAGYVTSTNPADIAHAIADFFTHNRNEELTKGVLEMKKQFAWEAFVKDATV